MPEAVVILDEDAAVNEQLAEVRALLETGRIEEARQLIREAEAAHSGSPAVRRLARVLEPPRARQLPRTAGRSLGAERTWLKQHGQEYPGCWLALLGDRLIAADADLERVLSAVEQDLAVDPLIVLQPRARS